MRLLVDDHGIAFDEAWDIVRATTSYTNHTLLPEALESWPVHLFERLLPRHMQIVYAHQQQADRRGAQRAAMADGEMLSAISLIDDHDGRRVRMGQLAFAGSHRVNGVSALHTDLMKDTVFRDLNTLYPGRINNKTNGITPRRWLQQVNPGLTRLLRETDRRSAARRYRRADGPRTLCQRHGISGAIRRDQAGQQGKAGEPHRAAAWAIAVDPSALFDVQIKRIHEYKRQLLNMLETIALYNAIRAHPDRNWVPRVKIFAGKAAASYTAGQDRSSSSSTMWARSSTTTRRCAAC